MDAAVSKITGSLEDPPETTPGRDPYDPWDAYKQLRRAQIELDQLMLEVPPLAPWEETYRDKALADYRKALLVLLAEPEAETAWDNPRH